MSVATHAALALAPDPRADDGAIRPMLDRRLFGVRELTLRRFGWTVLFVALFTLWSTIPNVVAADGLRPTAATLAKYLSGFSAGYTLWMVPAMIAVSIADNLPLEGIRRTLALAAALALAALISVSATRYAGFSAGSNVAQFARQGVDMFTYTSAIAVAFFSRRRDRTIAAALHASEIARVDSERARLNTVLQAMQARVEPAFLLGALQDVRARYATDRVAGGRMLDLLIQYLRSALPHMREVHSTLEREASLLRSYLGILAMRSDGALAVTCRFDDVLAGARIPPMILLPLMATAARHHAASGTINISAREIERRMRIALTVQGGIARGIAQSSAVSDVRERLRAIYGDRASLIVDRTDDALQLIVEIPHERTDRSHR
jgi:histidine kinase